MRTLPLIVSMSALLVGCGSKLEEDQIDGYRRLTGTLKAGGDGQVTLKIEPQTGESSLLLTSVPANGDRSHVLGVVQSDIAVFDAVEEATGDRASTNAGYLSFAATLNWPRSRKDNLGPMEITLGNVSPADAYVNGELEVTALFKKDPDLATGQVDVALVFAGGTDDDADLIAAMDTALALWADTYASVGLTVNVVAESSWPEGDLEAPVFGTDDAFAQIAAEVGPHVIPVVVTPLINDIEDVLGVAGDIPGPLAATNRSALLISAIASAGPDGVFDEEDIRLLGETLAHECGHYLGLFHPVETTWDRWDALDDTNECQSEDKCITQMRDLLMFPFPVCNFQGCTAQEVVTEEQTAVVHRYVGVD